MFKPFKIYDDEENNSGNSGGQDYMGYKKFFYPSSPIARQFAEKSRFEFMVDSMDEDMRRSYVNDPSFRAQLNKSLGFNQQYETDILHSDYYKEPKQDVSAPPPQEEGRGFWGVVGDFLRTLNYSSAGLASGLVDVAQGDEGASVGKAFQQAGQGFMAGFTGDEEHKYDYGKVMDNLGWTKEDNPNFELFNPSTWKGGNIAHDTVGFIGDVLLDPSTYIGGVGLVDDAIRGSGKVVKGTVAGADDIVSVAGKGLTKRSIIKEATEDEAVKVFQKIKGANYIPEAEEVSEFIRRTNQYRGIKEVEPLRLFNKELVSADTMSKVRQPLQSLSDMTIAPYSQKLGDLLEHSTKFSTKGAIVDLARTDPVALQNTFDFMAMAGEHGLTHAKLVDNIAEQVKELGGLDNDVDKLITNILEDESYYNKLSGILNKEKDKAVDKAVNNVNKFGSEETGFVMKDPLTDNVIGQGDNLTPIVGGKRVPHAEVSRPTSYLDAKFGDDLEEVALDKAETVKNVVPGVEENIAKITESAEDIKPGKAMWQSKDFDYPVDVVGYAGKKDGIDYVMVETMDGNLTGVPFKELASVDNVNKANTVPEYIDKISSKMDKTVPLKNANTHSITEGRGLTEIAEREGRKVVHLKPEASTDEDIINNIVAIGKENGNGDIVKGYINKFERPKNEQRVMHNPYQFKEKILHPSEIADKYGIETANTHMTDGGLVNSKTGEVVDYLKGDTLEKMSLKDVKDIAKGHDIPYLSDYKGLSIKELRGLDENDLLDLASKYGIKDFDTYTEEGLNKLRNQIARSSQFESKKELIDEIRKVYNPSNNITTAREKIIDDGINISDYKQFVSNIDNAEQALKVNKADFFTNLNQQGKEKFVADLIEKDPYLNNIFKHINKNGKLTTQFNVNNKTLYDFVNKYLEGDTKWFVNNSHKFHTDYNKALSMVNEEFGKYSNLTKKEKALRMDRMWDWYNNPKQLNEASKTLEKRKFIQSKAVTDNIADEYELFKISKGKRSSADYVEGLDQQIAKQDERITKSLESRFGTKEYDGGFDPLELGSKKSKNLINDDIERYTSADIDFGVNNSLKDKNLNQAFKDSKFAKDVEYSDVYKLDKALTNSKQPIPEDLGIKLIEAEITGTPISKVDIQSAIEHINTKFKSGANSAVDDAYKAIDEVSIGKVTNSKNVINKSLREQGMKNTSADEIMNAKKLSEEVGNTKLNIKNTAKELNDIPSDMKKRILNPSGTFKKQIKEINNMSEAEIVKVDSIIDLATKRAERDYKASRKAGVIPKQNALVKYGEGIIHDEEILNKAVEVTDNERFAFHYAKMIREVFKDVGKREVAMGKLNEKKYNMLMNNYVAHIITPESKELLEGLKKTNPDMYNAFKLGNQKNRFSLSRAYTKGTVLPDGYVLKSGSIKEINDHMKQYLNGNNMFADKMSDIYMSRMVAHNNLMYDHNVANDMINKFATQATRNDVLRKGESAVVKTEDIKKTLSKASDGQKAKFYADLGIEEGYFEKTYKPFMKLDNAQFNYFKKSNSIPTYRVNEVITDKAEALAKTQFGSDMNAFLQVYDKFHTLWKTQVTAVRPGFHARNAQSNVFQNYLDVGVRALDPHFNKKMLDISRGKTGEFRILGKKYSYDEIREQAVKHGVIDKGFFESEMEDLTNPIKALNGKIPSKYNPLNAKEFVVYKAGRELGNTVENQARLANFVANLERGRTLQEASEHVNKFLFDYGDLTQFEHSVMKRLIPFYTWMRKNVPLQLDQIMAKPGRYIATANVIDHIKYKDDRSKRPDYAKDYVALPFKSKDKSGKEYYIMWNDSLPYRDLQKVTSPTDMFGSITPFIKIPVELALGKNIFLDKDISDSRGEYLKDQLPGVSETKKLQKATGDNKGVAVSDVVLGSGLKPVGEKYDKSKKKVYPKETDKLKKVYSIYLYNKKKQEKEKANMKETNKDKYKEDDDMIY